MYFRDVFNASSSIRVCEIHGGRVRHKRCDGLGLIFNCDSVARALRLRPRLRCECECESSHGHRSRDCKVTFKRELLRVALRTRLAYEGTVDRVHTNAAAFDIDVHKILISQ
jgi:hypothetical protein